MDTEDTEDTEGTQSTEGGEGENASRNGRKEGRLKSDMANWRMGVPQFGKMLNLGVMRKFSDWRYRQLRRA